MEASGLVEVAKQPKKKKKPGPRSKKDIRYARARDRMFGRHLKEITETSSGSDIQDEGVKEFMKKYQSTHSSTVKAQLREVWDRCDRDFSAAGTVILA
ncbi:unnamed protein product, partial [Prorocentrum cordatum]